MKHRHRLPFGAEITPDGVEFRLWAPAAEAVAVELADGALVPMRRDADDIFSVATDKARAGTRYRYRIGGQSYPDPASRFQPEGAMGPSEVIDPTAYEWRDQEWHGRPWEETVLYELHVGAFSEAGDYDGVAAHLDHLAALGVTAIELMPLADCPGRWNWGYDGVLLYAPASRYGRPDDLKRLVEAAHMVGIAVILDVVYNHLGPEGNFLPAYAPLFFTDKHVTPWGAAVNFDDRGARHVRDFAIQNAHYWLEEFHLDGLRLDAVDQIRDDSHPHILVELGEALRQAITDRPIHLMLENYDNRASLIGAGRGGPGPHTAQWNDDFHHVLRVLATGADHGFYRDYANRPVDRLARVLSTGFAYQGEPSAHREGKPRGEDSSALPPTAFVSFIQNHDQVGNHPYGWRLTKLAAPDAIRALTAVLLLSPQIPMLFMGEEWASDTSFPFFCDFGGALGEAVREGRAKEFAWFTEFSDPSHRSRLPDPLAESTFRSAKLDWPVTTEPGHAEWLALHRDLIALRREHIVPRLRGAAGGAKGERFGEAGVEARWRLGDGSVLQLVANLTDDPVIGGPGVNGKLLYTTHPEMPDLPSWSVRVALAASAR